MSNAIGIPYGPDAMVIAPASSSTGTPWENQDSEAGW